MTRKQVMDAIAATAPQATPVGFTYMVMGRLFPERGSSTDLEAKGWQKSHRPTWSAFWTDGADMGFCTRIVVNDAKTFLSTGDGTDQRRLPVSGKTFFVLPGG